jgi:pyruvate formate lyase activating enzyme
LTGGEPTLHRDLPLLIRELKGQGFQVKLDTNGSNPEMLAKLVEAGEIDFVAMDVKGPLDPFSYRRSAGLPVDLNLILRSVDLLKRGGVEYQFRMTAVPGLHNEEDIRKVSLQLRAGRRLVLQNFNPENPLDPSLKGTPPYDRQTLKEIEKSVQEIF